jgi:hypothetical protein
MLTNEPSKHEGYFTTLEVGKAARRGDEARVPFLAHPYAAHGSLPARDGTVLLARAGDTWRVAGLDRRRADERVPSEGGPPPSRAPAALWIGAIAFGFVLAGVAHVMVRVAEATARRAAAAASGPAGGVATG